jgi:ubiquitin carboxyl-terminal hydrolase 4/11/15
LNRFSLDGSTKLTNEVNFPVNNLDMSPYVEGDNPEQYQYELFAVVNHMGGLNDGHYTVFIKHSDMKWYHINDERIQEVGNVLALTSSLAYCLFYRKKNE